MGGGEGHLGEIFHVFLKKKQQQQAKVLLKH